MCSAVLRLLVVYLRKLVLGHQPCWRVLKQSHGTRKTCCACCQCFADKKEKYSSVLCSGRDSACITATVLDNVDDKNPAWYIDCWKTTLAGNQASFTFIRTIPATTDGTESPLLQLPKLSNAFCEIFQYLPTPRSPNRRRRPSRPPH
jgi:hypothetical protein